MAETQHTALNIFVNLLPILLIFALLVYPDSFTVMALSFLGKAVLVLLMPLITSVSVFGGIVYCIFLVMLYEAKRPYLNYPPTTSRPADFEILE